MKPIEIMALLALAVFLFGKRETPDEESLRRAEMSK